MSTITLTLERTPRTLCFDNKRIAVEVLGTQLPFARKPGHIGDLGDLDAGAPTKVFVTEVREMTPAEFDAFASDLSSSREWLRGKGGCAQGGFLCIEITAPARPRLYVNPEGYDYPRYVARLG